MSFQQLNSLSSWNWHKDNERYFILQLNVSIKMRVESYFYSIIQGWYETCQIPI